MAVCDFGLLPDDAWRLTLSEFNILAEHTGNKEWAQYYRAAMIVAAIYNVNRDPKKRKEPFTPDDILGKPKGNDMLETAKTLTEFYGGEVSSGAGEEDCQK